MEHVHRISAPYKLAGRSFRPGDHRRICQRRANRWRPGSGHGRALLGESKEQLLPSRSKWQKAGARVLRGGAFAAIVPLFFQGMGEGFKAAAPGRSFQHARDQRGHRGKFRRLGPSPHIDIFRRARAQCRTSILRTGQSKKPVLLKRGIAATLEELLLPPNTSRAGTMK